jgi:hypothetical protein
MPARILLLFLVVRGCYLPVLEPGATAVEVPIYRSHVRAATTERSFGNKDFLERNSRDRVPKPPPALLGQSLLNFTLRDIRAPTTKKQHGPLELEYLPPKFSFWCSFFLRQKQARAVGYDRWQRNGHRRRSPILAPPCSTADVQRCSALSSLRIEFNLLEGNQKAIIPGISDTPCAFRQSAALDPQYLRRTPARANAMHCRVPLVFPLDPESLSTEENLQS